MPRDTASATSGSKAASPGWPMIAMPSGVGGHRLLELLDHQVGIPVRPHVLDLGAEVLLGGAGAVVDQRGERLALGSAREEDEAEAGAALDLRRRRRIRRH